ncbi:3-oxoacyl-synthase 2 [Pavlovales sp. CCMP2436]|nr:3-oxoacyl-synthase 2 [Pavlovales sp. CCMP2436]
MSTLMTVVVSVCAVVLSPRAAPHTPLSVRQTAARSAPHMSDRQQRHKVVVTGIAAVTSCGHNIDEMMVNLLAGKSGIDRVTNFDPTPFGCQIGSEVKNFPFDEYIDPKEQKRNDRYTLLAMVTAKQAVADAKLDLATINKPRFGVLVGSGIGGIESFEKNAQTMFEKGPKRVSPFFIPMVIGNTASGIIAIELGAKGPNFGVVSACATGTHAIGEAAKYIELGLADVMLCGGSEAAVTPLSYAGFCNMKAMCTNMNDDPKKSSRPFDVKRSGFIMGEGSGTLILESEAHAKARGAHIYCELAGYGATCDAHHITAPHPEGEGLAACLDMAIKQAGIPKEDVGYINAHGTSTPFNDKFETLAFKRVFGDHAKKVKISSTKSMTGHLLGAAGAIEAAIAVKVLCSGDIPPTINLDDPDPDLDLDYTPNVKAHVAGLKAVITDNLGFGGHNAALLFTKYE